MLMIMIVTMMGVLQVVQVTVVYMTAVVVGGGDGKVILTKVMVVIVSCVDCDAGGTGVV